MKQFEYIKSRYLLLFPPLIITCIPMPDQLGHRPSHHKVEFFNFTIDIVMNTQIFGKVPPSAFIRIYQELFSRIFANTNTLHQACQLAHRPSHQETGHCGQLGHRPSHAGGHLDHRPWYRMLKLWNEEDRALKRIIGSV